MTRINHVKCECGRTTARIDRICDRTEDVIFIRGNSVFLLSIENALSKLREIKASYVVYIRKEHGLDIVDVCIESSRTSELLKSDDGESVKCCVAAAVGKVIGMKPNVYIRDSGTALKYNRRKVMFIDERRY